MCLFFETIALEHGLPRHLEYHARRVALTCAKFFGGHPAIDLQRHLPKPEPGAPHQQRCRIDYGAEGVVSFSVAPYTPRQLRCFQLVEATGIDYSYKASDRTELEKLYNLRGHADEVIIVRDGLLTDTSIANIALLLDGEWLTPASPLLPGTARARLLDEGQIKTARLPVSTLKDCAGFAVMNALAGFKPIEGFITKD